MHNALIIQNILNTELGVTTLEITSHGQNLIFTFEGKQKVIARSEFDKQTNVKEFLLKKLRKLVAE